MSLSSIPRPQVAPTRMSISIIRNRMLDTMNLTDCRKRRNAWHFRMNFCESIENRV